VRRSHGDGENEKRRGNTTGFWRGTMMADSGVP